MSDSFALWVETLQAPRWIAPAWSIRSEGIASLEAARLQADHRASGPYHRLRLGRLLRRPRTEGRPNPRYRAPKSPGGFR